MIRFMLVSLTKLVFYPTVALIIWLGICIYHDRQNHVLIVSERWGQRVTVVDSTCFIAPGLSRSSDIIAWCQANEAINTYLVGAEIRNW